eukprot:scaffold662_cov364-Pavlova_lutheri.AAC.39
MLSEEFFWRRCEGLEGNCKEDDCRFRWPRRDETEPRRNSLDRYLPRRPLGRVRSTGRERGEGRSIEPFPSMGSIRTRKEILAGLNPKPTPDPSVQSVRTEGQGPTRPEDELEVRATEWMLSRSCRNDRKRSEEEGTAVQKGVPET